MFRRRRELSEFNAEIEAHIQLEIERLPARDGITHLLLLQIRLERPIMIPLAAPPFLDQLEWRGRSLLYIHVPQDKGATLIVNRLAHGLYDSRVS